MNQLIKSYKNLLYSIYCLFEWHFWQQFILNYASLFPLLLISILILGIYRASRKKEHKMYQPSILSTIILIVLVPIIFAGGFFLHRERLPVILTWIYLVSLTTVLYITGIKISMSARKSRYFSFYFISTSVIVAIAYLSVNFPDLHEDKMTKEELRSTFKDVFGRNPDTDDKSSFWDSELGDDVPSTRKKDEYWIGRGKE